MNAVAEIDDLEALFDQVAAESAAVRGQAAPVEQAPAGEVAVEARAAADPADMFQRVGHLTRTLHDALRELGYDRSIEKAVQTIPDARDRLNHIATLTGQAAERALGAVERAQAVQLAQAVDADRLGAEWDRLYRGELSVDEFRQLATTTRAHLAATTRRADETRAELHEIMMAQDFHDLTGQIINRVVALAQGMETQLLKLLVEARPAEAANPGEEWLTGPAINAADRADVVTSQAQVDDLLESLGF